MARRDEPTPLAVLLAAMHAHWRNGEFDKAAGLARIAAPYLHPRQGSTRTRSEHSTVSEKMTDAQIERLLEGGEAGEGT
jgi:hypothetical protein